jgi:hypothetical protein
MKRRLSDKTTGLITRLYEVVQPRPWFRGRPRSSAISALLRDIARSDEIGAVTALPGFLLSESPEVRDAASHAIVHLLSLVSPEELLCLGEFSEWGWWRSISTRTFQPSTIRSLAIDPTLHTSVFGIISFHHNGYVRHEAVHRLAQSHDGTELPYLLVRQNDRVQPISRDARVEVENRLSDDNLIHFVRNMSLVVRLLAMRPRESRVHDSHFDPFWLLHHERKNRQPKGEAKKSAGRG